MNMLKGASPEIYSGLLIISHKSLHLHCVCVYDNDVGDKSLEYYR